MKTESGETVDEPEMEPAVSVLANAFGDEEDIATRRRFVEVDRTDGEYDAFEEEEEEELSR